MQIRGHFCQVTLAPKGKFHRDSFRWVRVEHASPETFKIIGCPKRQWLVRSGTCKVPMKTHVVLHRRDPGQRCVGKSRPVTIGVKP